MTYFEDEPSKNEVRECYQVLVNNPLLEEKGEAEQTCILKIKTKWQH